MSDRYNGSLVLIVDADSSWSLDISHKLMERGYKTAIAQNGAQAFEMMGHLHPQLIICDLDLPDEDRRIVFDEAFRGRFPIPVVVTTFQPDSENPEVAAAIKKGAFDFLVKPFTAEALVRKIELTLDAEAKRHEEGLLKDFSAFFNRISRLNAASDIETLIDTAFDYFIQISGADAATFHLFDRAKRSWRKVREKADLPFGFEADELDFAIKQTASAGRAVLHESKKLGRITSGEGADSQPASWTLSVPINAGTELRGIVILRKAGSGTVFTEEIIRAVEIVALQVGNAFVNSNLYETVNRKLLELQIVSSYSEKLMGMVDKYDVIHALFEAAVRHFEVDFFGFLLVHRRTYEYIYWSSRMPDEKMLEELCKETVTAFEHAAEKDTHRRRIVYKKLSLNESPDAAQLLPDLAFRYVVPLCWDELRFGAVFFGAVAEPDQSSNKIALLSSIVGQTRIALTNTKLYGDMKENYIRTIKALAIAVDAKDTYTHGHSENVMNIAEEIAREMNIDEKTVGCIRDAGLLHDIDKIGIPGYILNKPGPLTYEEFNGIMKTHSTLGANIVRDVPFLAELYRLILYHHEHYDGQGYPEGLKGEQIPLGARILHVADAFEAMTSNRPYRSSLGRTEAIRRLIEGSGRQFDPSIIEAFIRLAEKKGWMKEISQSATSQVSTS